MVYAQPGIRPREWDFKIQTDHLISARWPDQVIVKKKKKKKKRKRKRKKRTCWIVDFAVPVDHRVKLKEEKKDKYLVIAWELKWLWNMEVTMIPFVDYALGTIPKGLANGLEDLEIKGKVETIQTTVLLRSARILRRVLETRGDLMSLKLQWETISYHWYEKVSK